MAGPACAVLLRADCREAAADAVERLIRAVGDERDGNLFWVSDSFPIGGRYKGEGRPFVTGAEPVFPDRPHIEQLVAAFGFRPEGSLAVGAMCKQDEDHLLLAEVAAFLAAELSGVVDVGGMLPLGEGHPGRWLSIWHRSASGQPVGSMVLDPEALWAWSRSPNCRMIK